MTGILWAFRRAAPGPSARAASATRRPCRRPRWRSGTACRMPRRPPASSRSTLVASGYRPTGDLAIPWWVIALSAVVLSLGTYAGGWRIMRTLGRRIVDVDPPHGFAAETVSAAVLYAATATGAPISTTHVITSAIMGVGSTRSRKAVRLGRGPLDRRRLAAHLPRRRPGRGRRLRPPRPSSTLTPRLSRPIARSRHLDAALRPAIRVGNPQSVSGSRRQQEQL